MKIRSRVVAAAAAAGLAAGLLIVGGGGVAHADTTFLNCDRVSGVGTVKPGLTNTPGVNTISAASPKVPTAGQYPRVCTGALAASVGPLAAQKGKLTGISSCATPDPNAPPTADPVDGKLDLTWTVAVAGKVQKSSTYIRLGGGATLDTFGISSGIVTKGPGAGMDLVGDLLQAPYVAKKAPAGSVYSTLGPDGSIQFGASTLDLGLSCNLGVSVNGQPTSITATLFSTDGTSIDGSTVNSSLSFTLP